MITNSDNEILHVNNLEVARSQCYEKIRKCSQEIFDSLLQVKPIYQPLYIDVDIYFVVEDIVTHDFLYFYTQINIKNDKQSFDLLYVKIFEEVRRKCLGISEPGVWSVYFTHFDITESKMYERYNFKEITYSF